MILVTAEDAALMAGAAIADGVCVMAFRSTGADWYLGSASFRVDGAAPNTVHEVARMLLALDDCELLQHSAQA